MSTYTTPLKIITGALRRINAIRADETPSVYDTNVGLEELNALIDTWSNDPSLIFSVDAYKFPLVGGQQNYTLGPVVSNFTYSYQGTSYPATSQYGTVTTVNGLPQFTPNWVITRPMRIRQATLTINTGTPQQLDIPLTSLTDDQYASVAVKNTPSNYPFFFYDDGGDPIRTVSVFPVPTDGSNQLTLWLHQPLFDYSSLTSSVYLPPGYEFALKSHLSLVLATIYGKEVDPGVISQAEASLKNLKLMNTEPQYMSGDGSCNKSRVGWTYITGGFIPGARV